MSRHAAIFLAMILIFTFGGFPLLTPQPEPRSSTKNARFPDTRDKPPEDWKGPVFVLSQDYPTDIQIDNYPWKDIDPKNNWLEYIQAVREYCYEGNLEIDWRVQNNKTRKWYHTPWLHWGRNGREFVHGLTRERPSQPGELALSQVSIFENWAVGMYNSSGGCTIGKVWENPDNPNIDAAKFPNNTVAIKLLFTTASVSEVPYLKGAYEWDAFIYDEQSEPTNPRGRRSIHKVRLIQIDLAIRDRRVNETTGWVFGTFVYNGNVDGDTPWQKMIPVGLMWGNDPDVSISSARKGHTVKESVFNDSNSVPFQHLGYAGRLNGPVDNPISSCLSCHATAEWPSKMQFTPPRKSLPDSPEWMKWFRNVKAGEPFSEGAQSLDYSLQLLTGISNYYEWKEVVETRGGSINHKNK